MADRRDRSAAVHMRDGVLRKGKIIGLCDAEGHVREADGTFLRGVELGSIDDKGRVRRKGGLVGRGELVGRIKGNAIYGKPGLLEGAKKLGYVDAGGDVFQHDCAAFRGRVIGKARGKDPESALAYFLLKFQPLKDHVSTLEKKVEGSTDKFAFLGRIRALMKVLPEVDAIGDFDDLFHRLEQLEAVCATQLGQHLEREGEVIEGLRDSVARLGEAASLEALRLELSLPGLEHIEKAEALVGKVAGRLRRDGRKSAPPPAREAEDGRSSERPSGPSSDAPDVQSPLEAILASTLGPMEKLREEVDRVRRDPEYGAEELWDKVRSTVASLLEHRDMTTAMTGRVPAGIPATGPLLPPPMPGPSAVPEPPTDDANERGAREQLERLLDTQAAAQVFSAIDGAVEGLEALRRARDDGMKNLREAVDEGAGGLRAIAKAREEGAAGIRAALERLVERRRSTPPPGS
jgi:hypothetical protein